MQPVTALPPVGAVASPDPLRAATQEFESLFVAKLLEAMRRTVVQGGALPAGGGEEIFRQGLDQEVAQRVAAAGGLGIGEMLYRQMATAAPDAGNQR